MHSESSEGTLCLKNQLNSLIALLVIPLIRIDLPEPHRLVVVTGLTLQLTAVSLKSANTSTCVFKSLYKLKLIWAHITYSLSQTELTVNLIRSRIHAFYRKAETGRGLSLLI